MDFTTIIREMQIEQNKLGAAINALTGLNGGGNGKKVKRHISAKGRAAIAAGQARRWKAARKAKK